MRIILDWAVSCDKRVVYTVHPYLESRTFGSNGALDKMLKCTSEGNTKLASFLYVTQAMCRVLFEL